MADRSHSQFLGFDGLRLLGAVLVMITHGFLLATGTEATEPLVRILGRKNTLGAYGVFMFFIISGFLLTRSLVRDSSAITYATNRALRILPAFVLCTLVAGLIIGPLVSSVPAAEYFRSGETGQFFKYSLDTLGDAPLPGVFDYNSRRLAPVVNGSLWSLKYEAMCYVALLLLWTLRPSVGVVAAVGAAVAAGTWVSKPFADTMPGIAYAWPYFAAGMLMQWVHTRFGMNGWGAAASAALLVLSATLGWQLQAFALFGAYCIVFIGERLSLGSTLVARFGDVSYGLYLYGWPAEQIVKQLTHTTSPVIMLLAAFPLALVLSLISYHAVERFAMERKRAVAGYLHRAVNALLDKAGSGRGSILFGARCALILGAGALVLSSDRWWYVTTGAMLVASGTAAGAAAGFAVHFVWVRLRSSTRQPAA